jgi:signal peptidase II
LDLSKAFRTFLYIFVSMTVIDQLVKVWARSAMVERQSLSMPWPGVFEFSLTYNQGVAFGMLQGFGVYMAPIALAMAILAGYYSFRNKQESIWVHVSLALIAAGAIGNLYDRVCHHRVTDMFWFRLIDFPVFNVADSCITVGGTILVIRWFWEAFFIKHPSADSKTPEADIKS